MTTKRPYQRGPAALVCLLCKAPLPKRHSRYCSRFCSAKDHNADSNALLRAARHAIASGVLAWDGERLTVPGKRRHEEVPRG